MMQNFLNLNDYQHRLFTPNGVLQLSTSARKVRKFQVALVCLASLTVLALTGCASTEKAEAIRSAAIKFSEEADAAIIAIDRMRQREIEPAPQTQVEATNNFIENVIEWNNGNGLINHNNLDLLIDPYSIELTNEAVENWNNLITNLRVHYYDFASLFERLPDGVRFTSAPVNAAIEPATKLTEQLVAMAVNLDRNPPKLLQHRGDVAHQLNLIKEKNGLSDDERRSQIKKLRDRFLEILQDEEELRRLTVEKLVKASILGSEITLLLKEYDEITPQDIQFTINQYLEITGTITGEDYSKIKAKLQSIADDSDWEKIVNKVVPQIEKLRSSP